MVVCGVTSCQIVGGYKHCRGNCCLLLQNNRGSRFLWNMVTSLQITWCHIPEVLLSHCWIRLSVGSM